MVQITRENFQNPKSNHLGHVRQNKKIGKQITKHSLSQVGLIIQVEDHQNIY